MLTDPTGGTGYSFGEILPSADATEIATQLPNALDGTGGGAYDMGAAGILLENNDAQPTLALLNSGGVALGVAGVTSATPAVSIDNSHATGIGAAIGASAGGTALILAATGSGNALNVTDGNAVFASGSLIQLAGTDLPLLASRSYNRIQSHISGQGSAEFTYFPLTSIWLQTDTTLAGTISIPVSNLISGATLTSVTARVDGNVSGGTIHANVPGTKPTLTLKRLDDTTATQIGSTSTDGSASAAAYDAAHDIAITGLTEVIDETKPYFVVLTGESGADKLDNRFCLVRLTATFSVTQLTPGG